MWRDTINERVGVGEARNGFRCRICGSSDHLVVLDYGEVALAGALLSSLEAARHERKYQLTLVFCQECSHLQIKEILDPTMLFGSYGFETGVTASMTAYCQAFAERAAGRGGLPAGSFVVELASNDGTMLQAFKGLGLKVLGIDPAKNIAEIAVARGIATVADFFRLELADELLGAHGAADLIVGRNVLAHVADLHSFAGGISRLLHPTGTVIIEVPHLLTMYNELQYDQVCHEHVGYHSLDSFRTLFGMHGLAVVDVDVAWVHGGSIRVYLMHERAGGTPTPAVETLLREENASGILSGEPWRTFGDRVRYQKDLLRNELSVVRSRGGVVAGYGASGKGQSLIQFCELDQSFVNYVVDKSNMKIGKWTPGSHLPVFHPSHMREAHPDVLLLFSWNLANEILEQEKELYERGVKFLHPIPVPHYL